MKESFATNKTLEDEKRSAAYWSPYAAGFGIGIFLLSPAKFSKTTGPAPCGSDSTGPAFSGLFSKLNSVF